MDIAAIVAAIAAFLGAAGSVFAAARMGVGKAQEHLITVYKDTIAAQQQRIATLEADLRQERVKREALEERTRDQERRIADLERVIAEMAVQINSRIRRVTRTVRVDESPPKD